MTKIFLTDQTGKSLHSLPQSAEDILIVAEAQALHENRSKKTTIQLALKKIIESLDFKILEDNLLVAISKFDQIRHGKLIDSIYIPVISESEKITLRNNFSFMEPKILGDNRFFEFLVKFPDATSGDRFDKLFGIDSHKNRLLLELELLLFPGLLEKWSKKHHKTVLTLCLNYKQRSPLILLDGDVGCGKTTLAETIGHALSLRTGNSVFLLKINTQIRGTGLVGEMTDLIVKAFAQVEKFSESIEGQPLLLLIDEADAIASKRSDEHMHHEDKAGLNTLLQRIDGLRRKSNSIAVIFITNRPEALDPAIRRRASLQISFDRPSDDARAEIFRKLLPEIGISKKEMGELVRLTGGVSKEKFGVTFTPSDITDRLLPGAVREAYASDRLLNVTDIIHIASTMQPSPAFSHQKNL